MALSDNVPRRHDRHFLWLVGFIVTSAGLVIAASRLLSSRLL